MVMQLPGPNYSKKDMFFFAHFWPMAERGEKERSNVTCTGRGTRSLFHPCNIKKVRKVYI
jgi:hypothetical protein